MFSLWHNNFSLVNLLRLKKVDKYFAGLQQIYFNKYVDEFDTAYVIYVPMYKIKHAQMRPIQLLPNR